MVDALVGGLVLVSCYFWVRGTNSAMMMNANNVRYSRHTIIPVLLFHVAELHREVMVDLATWTSSPRERAQRPRRTPFRINVRAGGRAAPA
jgi:hypothetical protein